MKERERLLGECSLAAAGAAGVAFGLLRALDAQLARARVHGFDLAVQGWVHGGSTPVATYVMRGLTFVGSNEVFLPTLALALAGLLLTGARQQGQRKIRKREIAATFALGIGGALALNEMFKLYFHRARPVVTWAIGRETSYSFPSGHSLFAVVLYGLVAYFVLDRRAAAARRSGVVLAAAGMALGIGLSRIYLGMHWPTDVLAGYGTGGLWLSATIWIDRRARTRRLREPRGERGQEGVRVQPLGRRL